MGQLQGEKKFFRFDERAYSKRGSKSGFYDETSQFGLVYFFKCVFLLLLSAKCSLLLLRRVVNPEDIVLPPHPADFPTNHSYAALNKYGNDTSGCPKTPQSFVRIMDDPNVSFETRPTVCSQGPSPYLLVIVLSSPNNFKKRCLIRGSIRDFNAKSRYLLKPLFLVGAVDDVSPRVIRKLREETDRYQDILQTSIQEHYGKIAYKTQSGFIWTKCFCPKANYILKMDDDVSVDYALLLTQLHEKHGPPTTPEIVSSSGNSQVQTQQLLMECPSPFRNTQIKRPGIATGPKSMFGKWALSQDDLDRQTYPPYCVGWAYVTNPYTAIRMAEMATNMPPQLMRVNRVDDVFWGFVVEQLDGVHIEQLVGGISGQLWNNVLSQCPILSHVKNSFFNNVVIKKGKYKNGIVVSFWYTFCLSWETPSPLRTLLPLPNFLLTICDRK